MFLRAIAIAATGLGLFAQTASAAEVEWKFFTYFGANDKPTQLHKAFAEDVEKATNGRLKITVFSNGELPYKASDVLRIVAQNQVEIGDVAFGFVAGDVPALNALSMPFSCTSIDKFYDKVAPAVAKVIDEELAKRFKVQSTVQWVMPPQQLWLTKDVQGIDGFKNLKVRSWNREQSEMMRILGGSGVTVTPAEVIPALQRKVVDGAFTAAVPALDWKFNEVTPYALMLNLTLAHQSMVVNQAALDKLPPDLKQTFLARAQESANRYRSEMIAADSAARKTLAEKGMTLRELSPADQARLREAVKPIWQEWTSKNGPASQAMLDTVVAACQ
jgi:TRAP-type C4-dicarboxylate transport system substrate-binding protein